MIRTILLAASVSITLLGGCRDREGHDNAGDRELRKPVESVDDGQDLTNAKQDLAQARSDLHKGIAERVARLDAKIDALDRRADAASKAAAKEFRARRDQLKSQLAAIGDRAATEWDAAQAAASKRWDQLETDIDNALE